jgi:hypothetical protein
MLHKITHTTCRVILANTEPAESPNDNNPEHSKKSENPNYNKATPPSKKTEQLIANLSFPVQNFIACGSPIGVFLTVRRTQMYNLRSADFHLHTVCVFIFELSTRVFKLCTHVCKRSTYIFKLSLSLMSFDVFIPHTSHHIFKL